jgi:hypothetical protein
MATTFCGVVPGDAQRKEERGQSCPPLPFAVAPPFQKGEKRIKKNKVSIKKNKEENKVSVPL